MEKTLKKDNLVADEIRIQQKWNFTTTKNSNSKFFGTFPFPYSNGRLHLGHGYTIAQVEFAMRYQKLNGKNILFPFGFHGTGMPIIACAEKLKESLLQYDINNIDILTLPKNDQIRILFEMGINQNEITKFVDPYYWITYFPKMAIDDLKRLGVCVDYSRSFVTTDLNPHFDSFVKWQFNKLHTNGYLKFGKKCIVFSPKDNQSCTDHDRASGYEGIGIKEFNVFDAILDDQFNIPITDNTIDLNNIKSIIVFPNDKFIEYEQNNVKFIASKRFGNNVKYQMDDTINIIREFDGLKLIGKVIKLNNKEFTIQSSNGSIIGSGFKVLFTKNSNENKLEPIGKYYEPEKTIISRSGDTCVVAIIDQWFIDYGNEKIKGMVNDYIPKLNTYNNDIKNMLITASEWIKDWPCSRSRGLGTKLLNTEFVIDSLSDSTIYMAYYTIAHRITEIPVDSLNDNIWEFIFGNGQVDDKYSDLLNDMKNEFEYWYPLDLRVSGKDLVNNHLTMSLYNHAMIWGNEKLYPQNYSINGYIMLNGEKMSKSTGVFMTVNDAINKYGSDATRIALAEAGSGIGDANFTHDNANNAVLKLSTERDWCMDIIKNMTNGPSISNFWNIVFEQEIYQCMKETTSNYENMEFHKALVNGFYSMIRIRDNYRNKYENGLITPSQHLLKLYIEYFLLIVYPICPHFSENIWDIAENCDIKFDKHWKQNANVDNKIIFMRNTISTIIHECNKEKSIMIKHLKKRNIENANLSLSITLIKSFDQMENAIIELIRKYYDIEYIDYKSWKIISQKVILESKINKSEMGHYGKLISYVQSQVDSYGPIWFDNIKDIQTIHNIIVDWIPKLYGEHIEFHYMDSNNKTTSKYNPFIPIIKISQ